MIVIYVILKFFIKFKKKKKERTKNLDLIQFEKRIPLNAAYDDDDSSQIYY